MFRLQHPDNHIMEEAIEVVTTRFFGQMDHVPLIALYDSRKDIALEVPREKIFTNYLICTAEESEDEDMLQNGVNVVSLN